MRLLLDTNAYVEWKRGHPAVVGLLREATRIYMSTVVAGELLFGFRSGHRLEQNLTELKAFLGNVFVDIVPVTMTTADRFGRIAVGLRRKGSPLPPNDIWIAAQALETGADLVSFDPHFALIDGLSWIDPGKL